MVPTLNPWRYFSRAKVHDSEQGNIELADPDVADSNDRPDDQSNGPSSELSTSNVSTQESAAHQDAFEALAIALTGQEPRYQNTVIVLRRWLVFSITSKWQDLFVSILQYSFQKDADPLARITFCLAATAELIRKHPGLHLQHLQIELCKQQILALDPDQDDAEARVTHCLFAALGWITNLYIPSNEPAAIADIQSLSIEQRGGICFKEKDIPAELARRSLSEMLRGFGDVLPTKPTIIDADTGDGLAKEGVLHVASLHAGTLTRVGKLKIEWTDTLTSHLCFDSRTGTINLFRLPTLCLLHLNDDSALNCILDEYYDDYQKPINFTVANFMHEVLLSYTLIFRYDKSAQRVFQSIKVNPRDPNMCHDPLLTSLCTTKFPAADLPEVGSSVFKIKETFDAVCDFPILSARLCRIQAHIDSIQPNRITSLWRDKRDILRWYTFWAVTIIGGLNLLVATFQAALGLAQVILAEKSLRQAAAVEL